jgi:hypothetical protein
MWTGQQRKAKSMQKSSTSDPEQVLLRGKLYSQTELAWLSDR